MTCAAPLAHAHHSKLSVNEDTLVECIGVCFNCARARITDADLHRAGWRVVVVVVVVGRTLTGSVSPLSTAGLAQVPAAAGSGP